MKILVSGLINLENNTNIHSFPIDYEPITYAFNDVNFNVSGVAYNVLIALLTLGDNCIPLTLLGEDNIGDMIISNLVWKDISTKYCFNELQSTPVSTVLFDDDGNRRIYCDLKDIQEHKIDEDIDEEFDAYVLTNINFNRDLLDKFKKTGKPIFTDVHTISDVNDEYNKKFMETADVLFMSDEAIEDRESFIKTIAETYHNNVIVMGCGSQGSIIYSYGEMTMVDALKLKEVKNTVGAGDALFSAFTHFYLQGLQPVECLKLATIFAAYKITQSGGSNGFLTEKDLLSLKDKTISLIKTRTL